MEDRKEFVLDHLQRSFISSALTVFISEMRKAPANFFERPDERTKYVQFATSLQEMFEKSL